MTVSCIVLAGGKSTRLASDKISETIGNRSLLQRVLLRISPLVGEIIVVTTKGRTFSQLLDNLDVRVANDIYPDRGPLGGIYTGLTLSSSACNLVVACDMPFLNRDLLDYMTQSLGDFDLVIPRLGNLIEPLHAVYSKKCLSLIEIVLRQDNLRVMKLLDLAKVRYLEADEIDRFDPQHMSFFNINTRDDLVLARKMATNNDDNG